MMQFFPSVVRGLSVVEFPRPVLSCRVRDGWDFMKLKVPRVDGDQVAGPSRDGVDITLEGQIGSLSGTVMLTEEAMLQTVDELRGALQATDDAGYSLSLFRDSSGNLRYFQRCLTTRLELDFSNPQLFSYSAHIHASDPVFHGSDSV